MFIYFRECVRGDGEEEGDGMGGREREREIHQLPPVCAPTGNWTCKPGMCPDRELNLQPFGAQEDAPTNGATWPGMPIHFPRFKDRLLPGQDPCGNSSVLTSLEPHLKSVACLNALWTPQSDTVSSALPEPLNLEQCLAQSDWVNKREAIHWQ